MECTRCRTIRVEQLPWAKPGSRFTKDFEETVAYLAQVCDQTQVTKLMGSAWSTVESIAQRVVA
ncbi:MAG: transposase family protein [Planctomycetota bacterium]